MKKVAIVLFLTIVCFQFVDAQDNAISNISSLKQIAQDKATWSLQDSSNYFNNSKLGFVKNGWWYVVSYEDLVTTPVGFVYGREAFLWKRKIGEPNWVKACNAPLFEHSYCREQMLTFDPSKPNSDVQAFDQNGESIIVMFVGMNSRVYSHSLWFTRIFIFYPISYSSDGSIKYSFASETLSKNGLYRFGRIERNKYFDVKGDGYLTIEVNDDFVGYQHTDGRFHKAQRSK